MAKNTKRSMAQLIYSLATQRGASPRQARELVAASLRESGLNPRATNKSSGAAGLFQLLSSGYRQKAAKLGGIYNPRANILAILPSYLAYWRSHPNAAPGQAAAAVEASGKGASWYAQPLSNLGYGLGGGDIPRLNGGGSLSPSEAAPSPAGNGIRQVLLKAILNNQGVTDVLPQIRAAQQAADTPLGGDVSSSQPLTAPRQGFTPAELFYRNMALKFGQPIGPVKGHFDHVHVAYQNPQAVLQAIALARRMGLRVGENPYVGGVDPVHVPRSYHYRTFAGKYNGRRLGEALDVSGQAAAMMRFYKMLAGR